MLPALLLLAATAHAQDDATAPEPPAQPETAEVAEAAEAAEKEGRLFVMPMEAIHHVGETATVCGRVASAKFAEKVGGKPTFINLDAAWPNHVFTVVIWESNRAAFDPVPEHKYKGHVICVTGEIETFQDKPQIEAQAPGDIQVLE